MSENSTSQERIGDFLVKIGAMSDDQRDEVLAKQAEEPGRLFGEIAIELGYIKDDVIDRFLQSKR